MRDLEDLEFLVDMGTPLVFVETGDATRIEELFRRVGTRCGKPLFRWSLASGLARVDGAAEAPLARAQPNEILARVLSAAQPSVYLLLDLARYLDDRLVLSQLREIGLRQDDLSHTLILPGTGIEIPQDLRAYASELNLALPTLEELDALLREEAEEWGRKRGRRVQATASALDALKRNLLGLSHADARRLVRGLLRDDGVLGEDDLPGLLDAKYKLLDQGGVLSFETNTTKLADVAGLKRLKTWLAERREVFLAPTPTPGLDPPKGVLLLGVQGGGKSLAAKCIAGSWGLPLMRLDFAALYNKYYGETERNLREALRTAAAMAPCVLWIDEIEKGLASEGDDGGPGKRILGTLLTWMAERRDKTFLVATANDIAALPPELLRKGRFDEIFFVDLPSPDARSEIFAIHLRKRGQDPAGFDLAQLSQWAEGFAGAEIEQSVVAALYAAKAQNVPLAMTHFETAIKGTKPLSVVMAEKMAWLRGWAAERTVPAD